MVENMNISIKTIPHSEQRYPTVGDWLFDEEKDHLSIMVSSLGDWRKELSIAVHELVEFSLCRDRGITQTDVDMFDSDFENQRPEGNTDEPGDAEHSPYRDEHCFATGVERLLISEFGISWSEYEKDINNL